MTIDKNSYGADVCETCNGRGEIGGWVGQTAESAGWDSMPCPDCDRQVAAVVVTDEMVARGVAGYEAAWAHHEEHGGDKPLSFETLVRAALNAALENRQ